MSIKGFEVGGVQQQYDYTALDNIPANLVQDANYVHTDNNFTNADKTKLSGIEAQANKTTIDATLTRSGQAADAKATGDGINDLKSAFDEVWQTSSNIYNPDDLIPNKVINNSGDVVDSSNFGITESYFELPFNGDNYFFTNSENVGTAFGNYKGVAYIATYNASKQFLKRVSMSGLNYAGVSTNGGAKYVRFVIGKNTNSTLMLVVKPVYTQGYDPVYEPYGDGFADQAHSAIDEQIYDFVNNDYDVPLKTILKTGGMTAIFRTAGVVGDSLSSGCMEYKDGQGVSQGYDRYEFSWIQQMKHICGFDTAYNFSAGGLTAKKFWTSTNSHIVNLRDDGENHKCQLYFIALGVNDIADTSLDVGTNADISNDSSTTFYGYYSRIIKLIQTIQPRAKIFLVGLPNHSAMTVWGARFTSFKNAIADMVNYFDNCYYLDLFAYDVPYDADMQEVYFNGFHENASGYLRSAWVISTYVDWIIRNNYEDFREVGLIGTDYHYYTN